VLQYLKSQDGQVTLGELAEHVAAVENDTTVAQITSKERKCVYVGLYQCHLPKMDEMNIVDFNQNRGRVELGPTAPQLDEYLETSTEPTRPWAVYYGTVGVLGLAFAVATGVIGNALWATVGVQAAMLVAIAGLAVAQHREQHAEN